MSDGGRWGYDNRLSRNEWENNRCNYRRKDSQRDEGERGNTGYAPTHHREAEDTEKQGWAINRAMVRRRVGPSQEFREGVRFLNENAPSTENQEDNAVAGFGLHIGR